jgi:hypothetical protein
MCLLTLTLFYIVVFLVMLLCSNVSVEYTSSVFRVQSIFKMEAKYFSYTLVVYPLTLLHGVMAQKTAVNIQYLEIHIFRIFRNCFCQDVGKTFSRKVFYTIIVPRPKRIKLIASGRQKK